MRDYQAVVNNYYVLHETLYKRMLAVIRDYPRRKEEYNHIAEESPGGMSPAAGTSGKSDITANKAVKLAGISLEVRAIEAAISEIPKEYIDGVWNNIQHRAPYPTDADMRTYKRYKQKFIHTVAENLNFIK